MATHLFIAGHGRQRDGSFDPGATGIITKGEHRYMKENLFPAMKKYVPKGEKIVFFSDHKVNSYGDLVQLAKKHNAKTVTEFHYDAASASARGGHVIIYSGFSPDKTDLAIRDAIDSMVGVRYSHKGYKGISGRNNLYNVNLAAQNGINYRLVELGFGTNKTDADIMVNKVDEYAKKLVKAVVGSVNNTPVKKTKSTKTKTSGSASTSSSNTAKPTGNLGLVDWMKSKKMDSSFNNRAKLAKQHGIKNYTGTASQNTQLLAKLQGGSKTTKTSTSKSSTKGKTIAQMANEIMNNPKAPTGHAQRQKWLGVDSATYAKVRNEVNRRAGVKTSTSKSKQTVNIKKLADKIINDPKAPKGHSARQKWLGVDSATYAKVRAEVNKRFK